MEININQLQVGDIVQLSGDSAEFGLDDYSVRLNTAATVEQLCEDGTVFVTIDEIDHDRLVLACVPVEKVRCA